MLVPWEVFSPSRSHKPKVLPYNTTNSDRCNKGGTASAHWPIESHMALGQGWVVGDVAEPLTKTMQLEVELGWLFDRDA